MPAILRKFDYEKLNRLTRIMVEQNTKEIRDRVGRAAQNIFEVGERLILVKEQLEHGQFLAWLEHEFQWSERAARRMMEVAISFKTANLADLQTIAPSALYLLASDSTPPEVREAVLEKAKNGKPVTHKEVKTAVEKSAPPKPRISKPPDESFFDDDPPKPTKDARPKNGHAIAAVEKTAKDEPEPPTDQEGNPLKRKDLIELFERRMELSEILRTLTAIKSQVLRHVKDKDELYHFMNVNTFQVAIDNVYRIVKFSLPHALCPYHGEDPLSKKHCDCCEGTCWCPKDRYAQAPESMRKGVVKR